MNIKIDKTKKSDINFEEFNAPNGVTSTAIQEGRKAKNDSSAHRYSNMDYLKAALEE